jgi:hypothetical protein
MYILLAPVYHYYCPPLGFNSRAGRTMDIVSDALLHFPIANKIPS